MKIVKRRKDGVVQRYNKKNKTYAFTSKSVSDNPQRAVLKDDFIVVYNKYGRDLVFKYSFKVKDYMNFMPIMGNRAYAKREFIRKHVKGKLDESNPFHSRVIDSQISAINKVIEMRNNDKPTSKK